MTNTGVTELKVCSVRVSFEDIITGVNVRAIGPDGKYGTYDAAVLDDASLLSWLRSRDGDNILAENMVGILLGRGALHPLDPAKPDSFTWNKKDGYNRRAIEAFLREAEARIDRLPKRMAFKPEIGRLVIGTLRGMLDLKPSDMLKEQ